MSVQWFVFPDDGRYIGCVDNGYAEGLGVSLGPQQRGEYAGTFRGGYEVSGVYSAESSSPRDGKWIDKDRFSYEGEWAEGRRNGLGIDCRGNWVFRGEWSQGFRGRYGVRQNTLSAAGYGGTWTSGLPDGYGVETYTDGSTYKGQWLRGQRHGYGTRQSASYKLASALRSVSPSSLSSKLPYPKPSSSIARSPIDALVAQRDLRVESMRGGFVLLALTTVPPLPRKRGLLLDRHGKPNLSKTIMWQFRRQSSPSSLPDSRASSFRTTDGRRSGSVRSAIVSYSDSSSDSISIDDDACSFISLEDVALLSGADIRETYRGEWKNDKRSGYGVCDRSDGLKYEGEWLNNRKHGYGSTTLPNGNKINGKYRNNILVTSVDAKGLLVPFRTNRISDRVTFAVEQARRAADNAEQKVEMATARMLGAEERAVSAEIAARKAVGEAEAAKKQAAYIMSHSDPRSDLTLKCHCPSETVFLLEHDPMDKEYLFTDSLKPKKKRFSLMSSRPRANSLTNDVGFDTKTKTNPVNQNNMLAQRNQVPVEKSLGTDRYNPTSAHLQQAHPTRDVVTRQATRNESSHPATISRLSSVPGGYDQQLHINQQRRKSLPSIVKEKVIEEVPVNVKDQHLVGNKPSHQISMVKPTKRTETYIIENGVHKLVKSTYEDDMKASKSAAQRPQGALSHLIKSSFNAGIATTKPRPSIEQQFDKMYKTESPHLKKRPGMGSTPDVSGNNVKVNILPREQVYVLSQRRREELIMERAAAERRKQNHIVLSFGDMKEWIGQHVLLVCFMFVNGMIAIFLMRLI